MTNLMWLAQEARTLHAMFQNLFYGLILVFLLIGVLVEYFKWPLGQMPAFGTLVGRALVAAVMLATLPDVMNMLSEFSDSLAAKLGNLNQFQLVLTRMGQRLKEFSFSWVKVKETIVLTISFVSFFVLYASVHIANAFLVFTWVLLYVFSPLLISLFVLPATASATSALYRSLIEVCAWKIVWSVLATLLWSAALSDMNKTGHDISFVSAICFSLMLAGSLLMTPVVVHALASSGLSNLSTSLSHLGVGPTAINPLKAIGIGKEVVARPYNVAHGSASALTSRYFPSAERALSGVPRMETKPLFPKIFESKRPGASKDPNRPIIHVHVKVPESGKPVTKTKS